MSLRRKSFHGCKTSSSGVLSPACFRMEQKKSDARLTKARCRTGRNQAGRKCGCLPRGHCIETARRVASYSLKACGTKSTGITSMAIPFIDLAAQQSRIRDRLDQAISAVLDD